MVMLLPFKPETYELGESSPFPTKDALGVTAWKGVEDIVELIIQIAYLSVFGADTFVILNLLGTVIMMVYTLIGKLLNYACVPDPEHDKFTSTETYTWEQVAESDELGQFLTEAGITSTKQRSKLQRLLHRDGFDAIGDFHGMSSANIQVYLNKGIPHMNVLKLVEYIHDVWDAHGQEKIVDLKPPSTPKGVSEGTFASLDDAPPLPPTNDRGSILTLKEREEAAQKTPAGPKSTRSGSSDLGRDDDSFVQAKRPSASRVTSSKIRRDKLKADLLEALKTKDRADLLEIVWNIGIRQPQELADIEWEDVSEEGVTKIQFKALQRIGREHAAPSSASTKLTPPTPGYETAKGWNAPPSGDVEMQLVKQPAAANETSLGDGEGQTTQI